MHFPAWNLIQFAVFGAWLTLQVGLMVCTSDDSFKKHNNPIYICEWQSKRFYVMWVLLPSGRYCPVGDMPLYQFIPFYVALSLTPPLHQ